MTSASPRSICSELLGSRFEGHIRKEMESSAIGNPSNDVEEAPSTVKAGHARVRVEMADSTKTVSVREVRVKQSGIIDSDNEGDGDVKESEGLHFARYIRNTACERSSQ